MCQFFIVSKVPMPMRVIGWGGGGGGGGGGGVAVVIPPWKIGVLLLLL